MTDAADTTSAGAPAPGRRWRLPLMLLGPAAMLVFALVWYLHGGRYEQTDDAYVQTAMVAISANVAGRVQSIAVQDNEAVRAGDLLFRLDDAPFRITVESAAARLAAARLQIQSLKAGYEQSQADLRAAQDTLAFQQHEYERQERLLAAGVSSQLQVDAARHAADEARARLAAAQQQRNGIVASLGGDPDIAPEQHPEVQQAQAALERARLDLSYTVVNAPADGVVTRVEQLQVGAYIAASAPVFALVSTHDVWIQANFKENQLAHMRAGQPVTIKVDSYPGMALQGRIDSLSPGTGSQYSVLPAENATGNWVKVVQRLPVRIELDNVDPEYPLHAGLSAEVSVDTGYRRHLFGAAEAKPLDSTARD